MLTSLTAGTSLIYDGNKVATVSEDLAAAFQTGDRLIVVQDSGALLHIPSAAFAQAKTAVDLAYSAFLGMGSVTDDQISTFYEAFANKLEDDAAFAHIAAANAADVEAAKAKGRSVTRLILSDRMRADMIAGLRGWRDQPSLRGSVSQTIQHEGWALDQVISGLGVVGFVFEGRPNVFADATGVLRAGNTVVFRIGSDALGTARAIVTHALDPSLQVSGLPPGAVSLVDDPSHASAWALFSDSRLALAVGRGSGAAVSQLGAVAQQSGNPVSLHGTGGAWIVADGTADVERFSKAVQFSLDRKVCNTLNTCCITSDRADELVPIFLEAIARAAAERNALPKLHVAASSVEYVPAHLFDDMISISRAGGSVQESAASVIGDDQLGLEWEWEESPEVTLVIVESVEEAVGYFNTQSPRFAASLISESTKAHESFFNLIDAPFVGDGFTRWVDGQYALNRPELGLSNWQSGRLFARGGVLSGDSVFTVRSRVRQEDPNVRR